MNRMMQEPMPEFAAAQAFKVWVAELLPDASSFDAEAERWWEGINDERYTIRTFAPGDRRHAMAFLRSRRTRIEAYNISSDEKAFPNRVVIIVRFRQPPQSASQEAIL